MTSFVPRFVSTILAVGSLCASASAQWSPPIEGIVPVGVKQSARVFTAANGVNGPDISASSPSFLDFFSAVKSKLASPMGGGGHVISPQAIQSQRVTGAPDAMFDSKCLLSYLALGFAPIASYDSESFYTYAVPQQNPIVRRKTLWIYFIVQGSPNVALNGNLEASGTLMSVTATGGYRVVARSIPSGQSTQFVIDYTDPTQAISYGPYASLNHFLMLNFPASEKFSPGGVLVENAAVVTTAFPGSGMKFANIQTWLMWFNTDAAQRVVFGPVQ